MEKTAVNELGAARRGADCKSYARGSWPGASTRPSCHSLAYFAVSVLPTTPRFGFCGIPITRGLCMTL